MGDQWDAPLLRWHIPPDLALVRWMKRRFTSFYMRADAFACNCRDNENEALDAHVPREHVYYLPNSVDTERYRPARGDEKARILEARLLVVCREVGDPGLRRMRRRAAELFEVDVLAGHGLHDLRGP